jgi:hypothetical protein
MNLDISLDTEARLAAKASEQGLSISALLERLLDLDNADDLPAGATSGDAPQLPVWHLGLRGSLHRRNIYGDVS